MNNKHFRLYYKEHLIADVMQAHADFPGLWGTYHLAVTGEESNDMLFIIDYINLSAELSKLSESCMEDSERYEQLSKEEKERYSELIDSNEWKLVDKEGKIIPVMVPVFAPPNEIGWRYDFSSEA